MPEITRRRLLGAGAAAAGGAMLSSLVPPNLAAAMAKKPAKGTLKDIQHVVVLMQENRSFDHYFGTLAGVRGFADPNAITLSTGKSVFYQPTTSNPDGYLLPWHLDTKTTSSQAIPSTSHAWAVQHQAVNGGKNDSWLPAHIAADGPTNGPFTMSYYERQDIPFHFALAENFTICDGYHCSLLGPTWPNRMYLMTGWIDPNGTAGGPIITNVVPTPPYNWSTYPERLEAGRDQLAGLPGGGRLRHQRARVLPELPERRAGLGPVRAGADDLPAGEVRGRLRRRQPADRDLDRADLGQVRAPVLSAGDRRRLAGVEDRGGGGQPGSVGADAVHPQLRRERRSVRPRAAAAAAGGHSG